MNMIHMNKGMSSNYNNYNDNPTCSNIQKVNSRALISIQDLQLLLCIFHFYLLPNADKQYSFTRYLGLLSCGTVYRYEISGDILALFANVEDKPWTFLSLYLATNDPQNQIASK